MTDETSETTAPALTEAERERLIDAAMIGEMAWMDEGQTDGVSWTRVRLGCMVDHIIRAYRADHDPPGTPRPGAGAAGERDYGSIAYRAMSQSQFRHGLTTRQDFPFERLHETTKETWHDAANAVRDAVLADPAAGERAQRIERAINNDLRGVFERWAEVTPLDRGIDLRLYGSIKNLLDHAAAPDGGDGGVK